MTGFSSKLLSFQPKKDCEEVEISINLKTLNSRFFEATCKLPSVLNPLETEIIKFLKKDLFRGHVYLSIYFDNSNALKSNIQLSTETASGYIKAIKKLQKNYKLEDKITVHDMLSLPGIFTRKEATLSKNFKELLFSSIQKFCQSLIAERKTEGSMLQKDIENRISIIEKSCEEISKIFEKTLDTEKKKLSSKIEQFKNGDELGQELYSTLDKIDINEEIVRLKSHLTSLSNTINLKQVEKGKALDFTLQEMFREINTIAAKSINVKISEYAIAIKVEIEKIREQVQNIV